MVLGKYRASTSAFWSTTLWIQFGPCFSFKIEGVNIIEVLSLIIDTTMATKDNDFIFEDAGSHIGSWRWSTNIGLIVLQRWLATDSSPLQFFNMKNPSIIQSGLSAVMATKDEELVSLGSCLTDMLRSSHWLLGTANLFLGPSCLVSLESHGIDIWVWEDLTVLSIGNTSVK
jgi:hypothetical protein